MKRIFPVSLTFLFFLISTVSCVSEGKSDSRSSDSIVNNGKQSLTITGKVAIVYANKGTLSEYHYFVIRHESATSILLNQSLRSVGFDKWVGHIVIINGEVKEGRIGFRNKKINGILVDSITLR